MINKSLFIDGYIIVKIGNKTFKYDKITYFSVTENFGNIAYGTPSHDVVFGAHSVEEIENGEKDK